MANPVQELQALLHDQPKVPLRPAQIKELEDNKRTQEAMLRAPEWQQANRGQAAAEIRRIDSMLATQAPKPLDPARANLVQRKCAEVLETVLKPGMLPQEVMRRNPAGAVDAFQEREGSPAWKDAALTWRRGLRALDPQNRAPNFTNLERHRPTLAGTAGATATFMANAQIGGAFAMTPPAKANWPLGAPQVKTALDGAGYVPPEAEPAPHPNASYTPEGDAANRQARAAGLGTVTRPCALDGCGNWFEATTKGPNPRKYCTPEHSQQARGQTRTAKRKAGATAPAASPAPEA